MPARSVATEIAGLAIPCNVASEADINAGVATGGDPLATPIDVWNDQWQINLMRHVYAVRAVLPGMLERGEGYLLHTASMAGIPK